MEFIKECSAISHFPIEVSFSCFFHVQQEYCCLAASDKLLYKKNEHELKIFDVPRRYQKLLYWHGCFKYLAYTYVKNKKEITVYHLDCSLREFDIQTLNSECTADVEDMWLDEKRKLLYFVFPLSIQKYNLNGDYLGFMMKAPIHTSYKAVCSEGDLFFVAYEKYGCAYVAQYDGHGIFLSKFNIGDNFIFGNMEIVHSDTTVFLNIYGKRQGCILVCIELAVGELNCSCEEKIPEEDPEVQEVPKMPEVPEMLVELAKGSGVGGLTCFLSCPGE